MVLGEEMAGVFATIVSLLALTISATTAWLTLFRRGTIRMTQPTIIFFGPDGGLAPKEAPPKIYLRTLLFATSKRGRVIESMHLRVSVNETHQNFNVWVYGDDKLVRGSGLFVGETGVSANHNFLAPRDGSSFRFVKGTYLVEVFAKLVGDKGSIKLSSQTLEVRSDEAKEMEETGGGLFFDWGPDAGKYISHVDKPRKPSVPQDILQLLAPLKEIEED